MRPELYVQVDNASDNKNKTLVGFLAFLVLNGYIRQAEIAFMMVGHTHEGTDGTRVPRPESSHLMRPLI